MYADELIARRKVVVAELPRERAAAVDDAVHEPADAAIHAERTGQRTPEHDQHAEHPHRVLPRAKFRDVHAIEIAAPQRQRDQIHRERNDHDDADADDVVRAELLRHQIDEHRFEHHRRDARRELVQLIARVLAIRSKDLHESRCDRLI